MKEHPTRDYPIEVQRGEVAFLPGFGRFVADAFRLELNRVVDIAVLPDLATAPWPPLFPVNWDEATDRVAALAHAFAVSTMTVAPSRDGTEGMRVVRFAEAPETPHTVFWIDPAEHQALVCELEDRRTPRGHPFHRSTVRPGRLAWVLDELVPRATLLEYDRRLLGIAEGTAL